MHWHGTVVPQCVLGGGEGDGEYLVCGSHGWQQRERGRETCSSDILTTPVDMCVCVCVCVHACVCVCVCVCVCDPSITCSCSHGFIHSTYRTS